MELSYDPEYPNSADIPTTRKQIGARTQLGGLGRRSSLPEDFGTFEAKSVRDIALFLDALLSVVSELNWHEQFSAPGVYEWPDGTLEARWNAARESALAAIFPSGRPRMFFGQDERRAKVNAQVHAAGQQVVEDWMVKSKLVSKSGKPLQWLMLLIKHGLGRPSHQRYELLRHQIQVLQHSPAASAFEPWPDLVLIQHLERLPSEKRVDWKRRMLAQVEAARERREQRVTAKQLRPLLEPANSGNNHKALILALCGVGWTRIFDHYRKQPGCTWNSHNSAHRGAQEFAVRLGLKWPLVMKKSGRPRKK